MNILIFIPAKNEARTIGTVIQRSKEVIQKHYNESASVLVVDDGSSDDTEDRAKEKNTTVLRHEESIGLGSAFQEAVSYATKERFEYMVTIDGDGQFEEEEIPLLLKPLKDGTADMVTGNRFKTKGRIPHMSKVKRWGNHMVSYMVSYILNKQYTDVSCGFRAYNREALLNLNLFGGFTYTQEVLLNLGYKGVRIAEAPITVTYFPERTSRIAKSVTRYGLQSLKIMLSSFIFYKPMRLFGALGLVLWSVSIPIIGVLATRYIIIDMVTPYKAVGIVVLIMFTLGFISFAIGTILYSLSKQQLSIDKLLYYAKKQ